MRDNYTSLPILVQLNTTDTIIQGRDGMEKKLGKKEDGKEIWKERGKTYHEEKGERHPFAEVSLSFFLLSQFESG